MIRCQAKDCTQGVESNPSNSYFWSIQKNKKRKKSLNFVLALVSQLVSQSTDVDANALMEVTRVNFPCLHDVWLSAEHKITKNQHSSL